jgi:hypothetical protein
MAQRPQTFENHAHRPRLTTLATIFLVVAAVGFTLRWLMIGGRGAMTIGIAGIIGSIATLIVISRAYTTKLQDRIIRLEMRVRTMPLLSAEQQRTLNSLSMKQIAALRFASDEELPALCERTAREHLAPRDIKRAVRTWVSDYDRT